VTGINTGIIEQKYKTSPQVSLSITP
jgi:hypothetical protein